MKNHLYIIGGILGFCLGIFTSWLAGFDFDSRGGPAFFTFAWTIALSFVGMAIGHDIDK